MRKGEEVNLQDWAAIAGIVGLVFVVGSAIARLFRWCIRRRDARPKEPCFGFVGEYKVGSDGVRWEKAWLQNSSERAYVHDVCCQECFPPRRPTEKHPEVARDSALELLLEGRKIKHKKFAFESQSLAPDQLVFFWVYCPLSIDAVELTVTMSVGRFCCKRSTFSAWHDVPEDDGWGGV